jgi:hypothetical protein
MDIEQDQTPASVDPDVPLPWTEIEPGRFQPKRTRGSNPGRELG